MSEERFEYEVMREDYGSMKMESQIWIWGQYEEGERLTGLELDNDPAYQEWLTRTLNEDLEYRMEKGE